MPIAPDSVICIFCMKPTSLERRGAEWFCPTCGNEWYAQTAFDKRFLRMLRCAQDPDDHLGAQGDA